MLRVTIWTLIVLIVFFILGVIFTPVPEDAGYPEEDYSNYTPPKQEIYPLTKAGIDSLLRKEYGISVNKDTNEISRNVK
jgi:hypothetical protein